jgi:phage shock protein A
MSGFERMEEKVRAQEARAKALAGLDQDTLEERFKQLEEEDEIEGQLRELKAKLGSGPTGQPSLPAGGNPS